MKKKKKKGRGGALVSALDEREDESKALIFKKGEAYHKEGKREKGGADTDVHKSTDIILKVEINRPQAIKERGAFN